MNLTIARFDAIAKETYDTGEKNFPIYI